MDKLISRRDALRFGAGTAGLGLLAACAPSTDAPTEADSAPSIDLAAAEGEVNFFGWTPGAVKMGPILEQFAAQYPDIELNWTGYTSDQYLQQMTTIFVAGTPRVDALWLREENMATWATAGYLLPIDGFPMVDAYTEAMYPASAADGVYQGKRYGLPYYLTWTSFVYNQEMYAEAGLTGAPKSLDEFKQHLTRIRTAGVMEAPLTIALQSASDFWEWWALVYASGGDLFDDDEPLFDGSDPVALEVLEFLADLAQTGLLNENSLQVIGTGAADAFAGAQSAMNVMPAQYAIAVSDPEESKVVGKYQMADIPSLTGTMEHAVTSTRQYGLGADTNNRAAAYQVISFMSGQDTEGAYWTQDYLVRTAGLLSAYPSVNAQPEVQALVSEWYAGAWDRMSQQIELGRPRQALKTPWFPQWEQYNQLQVQNAILGKITPTAALKESAARARDLNGK